MATNESIKKAIRRIRKELELDVQLVKTVAQRNKIDIFDAMFYIPDDTCYVSFPMEEDAAESIKSIIKSSISEDKNLVFCWDGDLSNAMLILNIKAGEEEL